MRTDSVLSSTALYHDICADSAFTGWQQTSHILRDSLAAALSKHKDVFHNMLCLLIAKKVY